MVLILLNLVNKISFKKLIKKTKLTCNKQKKFITNQGNIQWV